MNFANPAALALLALAIPIIAVHILRPLRREHVVSSTMIWERMDRPVTAAAPWQRLRPSWLLAAQLLALTAVTLAVANPQRVTEAAFAEHTVFLIDGSGSMLALDGSPDRIADARTEAIAAREELPGDGVASVIEVGAVPKVLLSSSADVDEFADAVGDVRATVGSADFAAAFALAESLETPEAAIGFVLVGDGGLSAEELRLVPPGLTYRRVGSLATNRAITDLVVEPSGDGLRVRVEVAHTGGPAATQTLRIDVDGRTEHSVELTLDRNDVEVVAVDMLAGDRVEAFLDGEDLLAIDNRRWAVTNRRSALAVEIVGARDPFLAAALRSVDGAEIRFVDEFDPDHAADVLIFDQVEVPERPGAPFFAIAAGDGVGTTVEVNGSVEQPVIALVRANDALLRTLDLTDVQIAVAQRLSIASDATTLVGAESAPLLVRGRHGDQAFLYLAFPTAQSNLPLQVAFPILLDRILAELGGSSLPPTDVVVGDRVARTGVGAIITDPFNRTVEVPAGAFAPRAGEPGFWTVASDGSPSQVVAVNPDITESTLAPAASIPSELRSARPGQEPPQNAVSWRPWIIVAGLVLLVAEFLLARRSVGVTKRQWRLSIAMRVAVAAALLAALFQPVLNLSADRVATVFLIDASDSLGADGRAAAVAFVREAIADAPDESVAGVVVFGGDARIESLVQNDSSFGVPSVIIDPSRTDLAAALRLGSALLPSDARQRLVLVSDGRATSGDVTAEAARLADLDVVVDTVSVGSANQIDAAVLAVDVPGTVRELEAVPIVATIGVEGADRATVTLRRDGKPIATTETDIVDGQATVRFVDENPGNGLQRYEVEVEVGGDTVSENNTGIAPVRVQSGAGVLIIEGQPGGAETLAGALTAAGVDTTVAGPGGLTTVEDLIAYQAVVLVDVDRFDLTDDQVTALGSAVRDTGRGLVTIGGTNSYALGGYLGSELEKLMPVVSDILDPQRRQTVAEVLAIDTSGSMGTCHCADGQGAGFREVGGVNKTDVARAAAARTIAALGSTDEVGIVSFDDSDRWVIDLQSSPAVDTVNDALGSLFPEGGTNIRTTLQTSAEQLRDSSAALKHIILFSDGFTEPGDIALVAQDAASLFDEGITVSVIATGEGAAGDLEEIAIAGGGRFYEGRDLRRIPEVILEEALLASRDFVNEGEFFPQVTSNEEVVSGLTSSPPLLGYVATTAKPIARTLLRIGPDNDPLLSTWQVGLGQSTAWASDAGSRWSQQWTSWDGYVDFWTKVVRDTFPSNDPDVVTSATVDGDVMRIEVDAATPFGDTSQALARITDPTGASREVVLDRVTDSTFAAEITVDEAGVYAVGSSVQADGQPALTGSALTARSYSDEYRLFSDDANTLAAVADTTGGRESIETTQAFDRADLAAGVERFAFDKWLLLFAALCWPLAVVVSRVRTSRNRRVERQQATTDAVLDSGAVDHTEAPTVGETANVKRRVPTPSPPAEAGLDAAPLPPVVAQPVETKAPSSLDALLASKRERDNDVD